ncbi:acetylglutamate kinase [Ruminiclostridium papyrosolvens DSM 2782]|uniref:Acetylglutamate kinase n=1 Tax=Ruminiclostridium papyrosolvens DSM 2782 TaxID=588581 RepID=F1TGT2_9FIRM|nr:acetylglutamate kinase [Ruminiclostridium papyrosolvens]EGD46413.1 acetylglutamate kinase [Ruminiclostridium papyrosolvens DSM 2782]WES33974.1 acetylglutamate kinase [Ruminiclostridium papyrosolvens DSM 2782]
MNYDNLIKKAEILIEALPYIQRLYGKTVVIKYGGNAMINDELKNSVMEDITLLKYIGMNPVLVHGGGPDINKALQNYNVKSEFVNGLRVTDAQTIEVAQMVLVGKTNKQIVSMLNHKGGKAIGLCGIDGKLIECEQYKTEIDGELRDIGYVGTITKINSKVLELISKDEYIPVVAPIGVGPDGESYNINADTVAGEIAAALKAEKLMLLTDVEGVKPSKDSEAIIPALTIDEVYDLIDKKIIAGGMIPKVLGCVEALEKGVGRTHIIDGRIPHCILLEIFTYKGIGTMIMKDKNLYHENEALY